MPFVAHYRLLVTGAESKFSAHYACNPMEYARAIAVGAATQEATVFVRVVL